MQCAAVAVLDAPTMIEVTETAQAPGRNKPVCFTRDIAGVAKRHWNVQSLDGSGQARRDVYATIGLETLKDEVGEFGNSYESNISSNEPTTITQTQRSTINSGWYSPGYISKLQKSNYSSLHSTLPGEDPSRRCSFLPYNS